METTQTERRIYQPTKRQMALPERVEIASDEQIKAYCTKGNHRRPWGLEKRDRALRALRECRDYKIGQWQGYVDAARETGYSDERFSEAYNLGYHTGHGNYASHRGGWDQATRERFDSLYLS